MSCLSGKGLRKDSPPGMLEVALDGELAQGSKTAREL